MTNKAIIFGITSVVGRPLSDLLISNGWTVYGTCRAPKDYLNEKINLITCDLTNLEDCQTKLSSVINEVSHLFFCVWVPAGRPEEEVEINTRIFRNALQIFERSTSLKHVYLQTGTKYYGMQLGPDAGYRVPAREDDTRLDTPIYYYTQEDLLKEKCQQNNWTWSIARPDAIIGLTLDTKMNLGNSLALYATLLKEEGRPLIYPNPNSYDKMTQFCCSGFLARQVLWMCTQDHAKNQVFNVDNGDTLRWNQLWPSLAQYFGMEPEVAKEPINIKNFFNDREDLWNRIKKDKGLEDYSIKELATPDFMQFYTSLNWDVMTSTDKIRSFGNTEHVDSRQMFKEYFEQLSKQKIIPSFGTNR